MNEKAGALSLLSIMMGKEARRDDRMLKEVGLTRITGDTNVPYLNLSDSTPRTRWDPWKGSGKGRKKVQARREMGAQSRRINRTTKKKGKGHSKKGK